jgi:hypothetical protein
MLYARKNHMVFSHCFPIRCCCKDRLIIRLGSSRCKIDFFPVGSDAGGNSIPRLLQDTGSLSPAMMRTGRISITGSLSSLAAPVQISESLKHNLHISLSFFFLPVQNILFMVQLTTIKFQ